MSAPIVWILNPSNFNFLELVLASGFLATLTGVVLTVSPPNVQAETVFQNRSSIMSVLRMLAALIIPVALIFLLYFLLEILHLGFFAS
jgi:hypothetical protein